MKRTITRAVAAARVVTLLHATFYLTLLLSGCAVAFRGTTQVVPIASAPVGAEVLVDGHVVGRTPLEVELDRASEHVIVLRWNAQERSFTLYPQLDGEGGALLVAGAAPGGILIGLSAIELASCDRRRSQSPGGWGFDFSGMCRSFGVVGLGIGTALAAIPIAIDAGTGGVMQLSPSEIFVAFE